jgi:hypothetical protein
MELLKTCTAAPMRMPVIAFVQIGNTFKNAPPQGSLNYKYTMTKINGHLNTIHHLFFSGIFVTNLLTKFD